MEQKGQQNLFKKSKQWKVLHDKLAHDGDHGCTLIHSVGKKVSILVWVYMSKNVATYKVLVACNWLVVLHDAISISND